MVVGEVAVHVAQQRDDLGADGLQQARGDVAGHAVAGIGHHLQRPLQLHVVGNALDVVAGHVALLQGTLRLGHVQAAFVDAAAERGDGVAGQRFAGHDDLETVVVRRIVAAGQGDAAAGAQPFAGEIHQRRRHHAEVGDVDAGAAQAVDQAVDQRRAGQAPVAADDDLAQAALLHQRPHGLADQPGDLRIEGLPDHAADVVGAEDRRIDLRVDRDWRRGRDRSRRGRCLVASCGVVFGLVTGGFQRLAQGRAILRRRGAARAQPRQAHRQAAPEQQHECRQCQHQHRNDKGADGTEAERVGIDIGHRRGDAQPGLAERTRQRFAAAGQPGLAAFGHRVTALAQCQIRRRRHIEPVERQGQYRQRQTHVSHAASRTELDRGSHAQAGAATVADHAHDRHAALLRGFEQGQPGITEGRRVGVGIGQIRRQHRGLLGPFPARLQRGRRRGGIAGLQCGSHCRCGKLPGHLPAQPAQQAAQRLHAFIARLGQPLGLPFGLPLLPAIPSKPARDQGQQQGQQRRAAFQVAGFAGVCRPFRFQSEHAHSP